MSRCTILAFLMLCLGGVGGASADADSDAEAGSVRFRRMPAAEVELWRSRVRSWLAQGEDRREAHVTSRQPDEPGMREPVLHVLLVDAAGLETRKIQCTLPPEGMPMLSRDVETVDGEVGP